MKYTDSRQRMYMVYLMYKFIYTNDFYNKTEIQFLIKKIRIYKYIYTHGFYIKTEIPFLINIQFLYLYFIYD